MTRIEGHAIITIRLDDTGQVADAHFHVTQFRGFERIVQGRPVHEMPSIMARICGICPVSHLVASAKACDEILAVQPPPAGADLRRVMNLAQVVQSNALSFFHLSAPDLLFGFDADPAGRNLIGMVAAQPQLARDGIALRRFGQQVIERLGGKRIHPAWVVPGGVDAPLSAADRDAILAAIPDALAATAGRWTGTPAPSNAGRTRLRGSARSPRRSSPWSARTASPSTTTGGCASSTRTATGSPTTSIRGPTGPTSARPSSRGPTSSRCTGVSSATRTACTGSVRWPGSTSPRRWAPREPTRRWPQFRARLGPIPTSSFHYHHARLIDTLHCLEKLEALLRAPTSSPPGSGPSPGSTPAKASGSPRRRAARSSTTTGWTTTGSSSG